MFKRDIKKVSEEFLEIAKRKDKIRIITHLDADGISSGALIVRFLEDLNLRYHISIFKQIYSHNLERVSKNYDIYIFTDLGSGLVDEIHEFLKDKEIFILDHHKLPENIPEYENLRFINPFLYGIDGDTQISSSGIAYLFSREIDPKIEELGYLSIVGMYGDQQNPFSGINKEITEELLREGIIEIRKGLRVFGRTYKPIHKALAYSFDPFLPGITGNEEAALKILKSSKIEYKIGGIYKTISDLSKEEEKELISNIIINAVEEGKKINPKEIIGDIITIKGKKGVLSDCREIATVLNAFGRLGRGSLGILSILGKVNEKEVYNVLEEYSKKISKILRKIDSGEIKVEELERVVIIHGEEKIPEELVGTITSILSKNYPKKLVVGYGLTENDTYKVSLRSNSLDCEEIVKKISMILSIEGGGHKQAAGMEIPKEALRDVLDAIVNFY